MTMVKCQVDRRSGHGAEVGRTPGNARCSLEKAKRRAKVSPHGGEDQFHWTMIF